VRRPLLLAALAINLGLAATYLVLHLQRTGREPPADFTAFYTAADMIHAGQGRALYDFQAQARHQRGVLGGGSFPGGLVPFVNPPHAALGFAPLHHHDLRGAFRGWTIFQALLLIVALRLVGRGRPPLERWLARAALVAAPPLLLTFELGALSLLLLIVVLKAHQALAAGRERAAGLWLALGTLKPQLVVGPVLATLAGRRWRAVAALAAAMLVAVLGSAAAFGWQIWPSFARALLAVHRSFEGLGIQPAAMHNLEGAVLFAIGPAARAAAPIIALFGWLLGCALTVWIWRGPWRPDQPRFELQMAATLLLGSFFSLHLYPQDGLLIVAAALLLDSYLRRSQRPRAAFAALVLASPALWFVTELAVTPRLVRFPVMLQLALGAWMLREWRLARRTIGSGETSPPEPFMQTS
jgi:hypothetical protein